MRALVVVDVQNDFVNPNGALYVPHEESVLTNIKKLMFQNFDLIIQTQDYHPKNHISFDTSHDNHKYKCPPHCIAGTIGAEPHDSIKNLRTDIILRKGTDKDKDELYSNHVTQLCKKMQSVVVCGFILNICVFETARHLVENTKADIYVAESACAAHNIKNMTSIASAKHLLRNHLI